MLTKFITQDSLLLAFKTILTFNSGKEINHLEKLSPDLWPVRASRVYNIH